MGRFPGREEPLAPSVSRSPPRHLRTSGRPMGPATPYTQTQFFRTNCFGFVWLLLGLRLVCGCCCSDFSGEIIRLFGFVPFRTCPLLADVFVVLSLFLWLFGCARRRRLLSFFLFRRWGNPNPFWGLGFPLCSLLPERGLRLPPVLRAQLVHLGIAPAPVFFFFFASSSSSLVCWLVLWRSVAFVFGCFLFCGGGLVFWVCLFPFCIACKMY